MQIMLSDHYLLFKLEAASEEDIHSSFSLNFEEGFFFLVLLLLTMSLAAIISWILDSSTRAHGTRVLTTFLHHTLMQEGI